MNKLLVLTSDSAGYASLLEAANLPGLEILTAADKVDECNIILGDPSLVAEVLADARALEWVQSSWAGVDSMCLPGMRRDYVLTGVKDVFGPLISEYVMAYLLAVERGLFAMRANQLQRLWKPLPYRPTSDITLGIVGLGSIGVSLADTASRFGIRVIGLNRSGKTCDKVERVYTPADIGDFLREPDYVVLTLPDTPQTKHFIDAGALRLMKSSAVLMNVGRGCLINEADLVAALNNGAIGGAVLDVFEKEPLPKDSPLWQLPNVFITPHTAAMSFPEDIVGIFVDNYRRFIQQKTLAHVIDFELGY